MFIAIGPIQVILILIVPIGIFFLGYIVGRKSGYIKRVKETEKQNKQLN